MEITTAGSENDGKKEGASAEIAKGMSRYLQYLTLHNESDPNLTTDMNGANRNEYKEIFRRIKEDDLPRLLPKFQKRLRENTIQDMAIFQSKLFTARDRIKEKIEEINHSLYDIDYNKDHYIEIECVETLNMEIKKFRQQLKNVQTAAFPAVKTCIMKRSFWKLRKYWTASVSAARDMRKMIENGQKWSPT